MSKPTDKFEALSAAKEKSLELGDPLSLLNVVRPRAAAAAQVAEKSSAVGALEPPPKTFLRAHPDKAFTLETYIVPRNYDAGIERADLVTDQEVADELLECGDLRAEKEAGEQKAFFEIIYGDLLKNGECLDLRALDEKGNIVVDVASSVADLLSFTKNHDGTHHVFFGVATRDGKGGKKENCLSAPCVWSDIDCKADFTKSDATELIRSFPLKPSYIVDSGGGFHCYWLLDEPFTVHENIAGFEQTLKHVCNELKGDQKVAVTSTLLRVPFTVNIKPDRNGARATIIESNPSLRYSLNAFQFLTQSTENASLAKTRERTATPSLDEMFDAIDIGNRDAGSMAYINAYVTHHGGETNRELLMKIVLEKLDSVGGEGLEPIKKKVAGHIQWAFKHLISEKHSKEFSVRQKVLDFYGENLKYVRECFLKYEKGYWKVVGDRNIEKQVIHQAGASVTSRLKNGVIDLIKTDLAKDDFTSEPDRICLLNGTYDLLAHELGEHCRKDQLLFHLPYEYDREADCPLFLQTLQEIFEPDEDRVEKINFLQEYFGYCLTSDLRFHKALFLYGPGGNGKSVVLDILRALVGEENILNSSLKELARPARLAELIGKTVLISSELSVHDFKGDSLFKQLTSGEPLTADKKYKDPFQFTPTAKIVMSTNNMPAVFDHSYGFERRIIILTFNREFSEGNRDTRRTKTILKDELPGIFNWAVEGHKKLFARGELQIPKSSEKACADYFREQNPVALWLETTKEDPTVMKTAGDLYENYITWSEANGFSKINITTFSKRLVQGKVPHISRRGQNRYQILPTYRGY